MRLSLEPLDDFVVVEQILAKGDTKSSVRVARGLQIDLRVVPPASWGAALLYFTGSKEHNVRLRGLALKQKLLLNEYGLYRVGAEAPQHRRVLAEVPLHGENADPERLLHGAGL